MIANTATPRPAPGTALRPACFDPGAALVALEILTARRPTIETVQAWDAAWIACLTNSPRWAEAARQDFLAATGEADGG